MYELIILSILLGTPAHGYLIAKIVNNVLGPYAKVNSGRLYPLLAKLEEQGAIEAIEPDSTQKESGRQTNAYRITAKGTQLFRRLMLDTSSNPGDYQKIFWLKAAMMDTLNPDERLFLIEHYINYCQSHVLYLKAKCEELKQGLSHNEIPQHRYSIVHAIEHRAEHWQHELEWGVSLKQQELVEQKIGV
ncbi:MAG: PadR family transcriptional regulator [Chloroflexi bacterium]|uniref:PadR family transcriptional regulator n=1 Tax=Candidatus Chlorohelix allophototropha TaxID=3003348 RepID=A0A8T7MA54_9CHLR|nr:PadR family transcriptional regulator [Chloroflexota bacterium]WJW68938.1 PadR family transcriptional regulator [Chloroflexota bacterium L227-S17]